MAAHEMDKACVEEFNRQFLASKIWSRGMTWCGIPCQKNPCDLWMYQQIIHKVRPRFIVELGTARGGTTKYLADIMRLVHKDSSWRVFSVDKESRTDLPNDYGITYMFGSSISSMIVDDLKRQIRSLVKDNDSVMVISDSYHDEDHVLQELRCYSDLVTRGSYFIVEDTNHGVFLNKVHTPYHAVKRFIGENADFQIDLKCECFGLTFNPYGYLKKRK